jgi:hypothetical protein
MIHRFRLGTAEASSTPGDIRSKLSKQQCPKNEQEVSAMKSIPYRELIGCLNYAVTTLRFDIAIEVHQLSRAVVNPGQAYWQAAKRVLRYLKGTPEQGLHYDAGHIASRTGSTPLLTAFSDSDFAADIDTRRSVSGWCVFLDGLLIGWQNKQQPIVALSTAEAEWYAACTLAQHLQCMRNARSTS